MPVSFPNVPGLSPDVPRSSPNVPGLSPHLPQPPPDVPGLPVHVDGTGIFFDPIWQYGEYENSLEPDMKNYYSDEFVDDNQGISL